MKQAALDRELERLLEDLSRLTPVLARLVFDEEGDLIDIRYSQSEIDALIERARALLVALDLEKARRGPDGGGRAA